MYIILIVWVIVIILSQTVHVFGSLFTQLCTNAVVLCQIVTKPLDQFEPTLAGVTLGDLSQECFENFDLSKNVGPAG